MTKLRVLHITDTHCSHGFIDIPCDIDMVIHSGDASNERNPYINANEMLDFFEWFTNFPATYRVFVPGNHDTSMQTNMLRRHIPENIHVLIHELLVIEGVRIFGSPYTPTFGQGWAFNKDRAKLHEIWKDIPYNTDILVTHGPPKGILDITAEGSGYLQVGCKALLNRVMEVQPKYHLAGHIHNETNVINVGTRTIPNCKTTFINSCIVDMKGKHVSDGHIFEI